MSDASKALKIFPPPKWIRDADLSYKYWWQAVEDSIAAGDAIINVKGKARPNYHLISRRWKRIVGDKIGIDLPKATRNSLFRDQFKSMRARASKVLTHTADHADKKSAKIAASLIAMKRGKGAKKIAPSPAQERKIMKAWDAANEDTGMRVQLEALDAEFKKRLARKVAKAAIAASAIAAYKHVKNRKQIKGKPARLTAKNFRRGRLMSESDELDEASITKSWLKKTGVRALKAGIKSAATAGATYAGARLAKGTVDVIGNSLKDRLDIRRERKKKELLRREAERERKQREAEKKRAEAKKKGWFSRSKTESQQERDMTLFEEDLLEGEDLEISEDALTRRIYAAAAKKAARRVGKYAGVAAATYAATKLGGKARQRWNARKRSTSKRRIEALEREAASMSEEMIESNLRKAAGLAAVAMAAKALHSRHKRKRKMRDLALRSAGARKARKNMRRESVEDTLELRQENAQLKGVLKKAGFALVLSEATAGMDADAKSRFLDSLPNPSQFKTTSEFKSMVESYKADFDLLESAAPASGNSLNESAPSSRAVITDPMNLFANDTTRRLVSSLCAAHVPKK
jgi:hypothetical protein